MSQWIASASYRHGPNRADDATYAEEGLVSPTKNLVKLSEMLCTLTGESLFLGVWQFVGFELREEP